MMGLAQPAWMFMDDEASHLEFEQRYPCTGHFRRTRTPLRHAIARMLPVRSAWWLVQRHLQIGSNAAAALPLCVHAYQWTFVGMSSPSYIYFVMSVPTDWALPMKGKIHTTQLGRTLGRVARLILPLLLQAYGEGWGAWRTNAALSGNAKARAMPGEQPRDLAWRLVSLVSLHFRASTPCLVSRTIATKSSHSTPSSASRDTLEGPSFAGRAAMNVPV